MPPKKQPNVKEQNKKLAKVIEDKTFGMKNKKGAKAQKYIQQLQSQIVGKSNTQPKKKVEDELDMSKIFKPVQTMPKIADDVDPKSVLCVFFKQGLCTKGKKCKFSHDLSVQQKTAKRNLYVDSRDLNKPDDPKATETNENWDEAQLNEVAEKKHGDKDRKRPNQTDIVCKYFIDAVEKSLYGWFWECPNGSTRANLSSKNQTKVTLETFIAWKKKKVRERRKKESQDEIKKRTNVKSGKQAGLTGRELFTYDEHFAEENDVDEEGGEAFVRQKEEEDPDEVKAFEIDDRTFMNFGEDDEDVDIGEDEPGPSKPIVFDENLFDGEDMEDLSDSDDNNEDQSQSSAEKEFKDKLKM